MNTDKIIANKPKIVTFQATCGEWFDPGVQNAKRIINVKVAEHSFAHGLAVFLLMRAQGCEKQTWRRYNDHFIFF